MPKKIEQIKKLDAQSKNTSYDNLKNNPLCCFFLKSARNLIFIAA